MFGKGRENKHNGNHVIFLIETDLINNVCIILRIVLSVKIEKYSIEKYRRARLLLNALDGTFTVKSISFAKILFFASFSKLTADQSEQTFIWRTFMSE